MALTETFMKLKKEEIGRRVKAPNKLNMKAYYV